MPHLRSLAEMASDDCLVKPLFYSWVMDAGGSINVMVDKPTDRAPDGYFHASQHPMATTRELYLWMTGQHTPEAMNYVSRMSVMFGSLGHGVMESVLDYMGVAVPLPKGDCPNCGRPRRPLRARPSNKYCTEHGYVHEETRSRCHLDSILDFTMNRGADGLGGAQVYGFDLKTIAPLALGKAPDMNPAFFRQKWPGYWGQMQECMRMSGLRRYIVLFLGFGNPWELREYHIPFDAEFAAATERKYRTVLYHVDNDLPIVA